LYSNGNLLGSNSLATLVTFFIGIDDEFLPLRINAVFTFVSTLSGLQSG
jgi:hypothetical protein